MNDDRDRPDTRTLAERVADLEARYKDSCREADLLRDNLAKANKELEQAWACAGRLRIAMSRSPRREDVRLVLLALNDRRKDLGEAIDAGLIYIDRNEPNPRYLDLDTASAYLRLEQFAKGKHPTSACTCDRRPKRIWTSTCPVHGS